MWLLGFYSLAPPTWAPARRILRKRTGGDRHDGREAKQPPLPEPRAPRGPVRRRANDRRPCRDGVRSAQSRAVRRRVGGRGHEWSDEELSERRVSYESAVPEMPAIAVSREPDASINSDLAGNDAVCSTCPSRPVDL